MYAAGSSIRQICRHLEENGIKTKTGKAKWAPNVISFKTASVALHTSGVGAAASREKPED